MKISCSSLSPLVLALMLTPALAKDEKTIPPVGDWQEQYAYSVGVQAYIYAFPILQLATLRHKWATDAASFPYAAPNHFYHFRDIVDAGYKDGGSPNNDTLYSWGFFDLSKEPVVLAHPDMGERYFVFQLADMYADNFGYVGKRTTGSKAGAFLIVGPDWQGETPANVQGVIRARTPHALVFGRTFVEDRNDVAAVNKLQDQYQVVPLSLWDKPGTTLPENRDVQVPADSQRDPLADWKTINQAMAQNPPAAKDKQLLELFATVGIGPGLNGQLDLLDEASKRGLARAAQGGRPMVGGMSAAGVANKPVNGWHFSRKNGGRAGLEDDFRGRAICAAGGIICNEPQEATYIVAYADVDGQPLDGNKRYTLHFAKGQLPPVKEFWSLTLYGPDKNLVDNPINRYAIRDRTPGVKQNADGSMSLYLQNDSPGKDKESNWLPSPRQGRFYLALRAYVPEDAVLNQTWQPPTVKQMD